VLSDIHIYTYQKTDSNINQHAYIFSVSFSALTLSAGELYRLVTWRAMAHKNLCHLSPKILFWYKWNQGGTS